MDLTNRPERIIIVADHQPGTHVTDSDEFCTGRVAMFIRCECQFGGVL